MNSPFLSMIAAVVFSLAAARPSYSEEPKRDDPIIGKWRWTDHQIVECKADNTFVVTPTNRGGTWKLVPDKAVERKYEFTWDKGLFVDAIALSQDGASLKGKNQEGKKIAATKVK